MRPFSFGSLHEFQPACLEDRCWRENIEQRPHSRPLSLSGRAAVFYALAARSFRANSCSVAIPLSSAFLHQA
jgi:hypothetical protein